MVESYFREFSDILPLAIRRRKLDAHTDTRNLINTIKLELLEDAIDDEKKLLERIFQRVEIVAQIIDLKKTIPCCIDVHLS